MNIKTTIASKIINSILFFVLLFFTTIFYGQTNGIAYQAVIYKPDIKSYPGINVTSSPLVKTNVCLQFTFYDSDKNIEYKENISLITDEFGMVNTMIGSGKQLGGYAINFDAIKWSSDDKKLIVELDDSGTCSNFVEISNQSFASVPFSMYSATSNNVTGIVKIVNGGTGADTVAGALINLGLNYVDNTSDLMKPLSSATQSALDLKENMINKSVDGTFGANSDIKFPTERAVKTYVNSKIIAATPDASLTVKGIIQLAGDLGGTAALPTVPGLALKASIDNPTFTGTIKGIDKTMVGLGNVDNTSDVNKPVSAASQTALNQKIDKILTSPTEISTTEHNTLSIIGLQQVDLSQNQLVTINAATGVLSRSAVLPSFEEKVINYKAIDGQTKFTTPIVISNVDKINVYRNGIRINLTVVDQNTIQIESGVICYQDDEIKIVQFN